MKHDLYIGRNPSKLIPFEKVPEPEARFISEEDIARITTESLKYPTFYPYFYVGLHTGLRVGELTSITMDSYSYPNRLIFLKKTKNGKSRHVSLSIQVNEFIGELAKTRGNKGLLIGDYTRFTVSTYFREIIERLGLKGITFHCLRHTFVKRLLTNGVPLYKVSKMVGHSSTAVTEQIYGHLSRNDLESSLSLIDSVFGSSVLQLKDNGVNKTTVNC